jgi:PST family polysaccharide transporter
MAGIGNKLAAGVGWMTLLKLGERGLGLVSTVVLARLLVPEDFGLTAMAMSLIGIVQLLEAFNFDVALIQNQNAERRHYDTAWTINLLFAAGSAAILFALAEPAADFYSEPRLVAVIQVLSLGVLITGFRNIGVVAFRKDLAFDKEFRFLLTKKVVSVAVTLTAAVLWRSYWALVAGTIVGWALETALSYGFHPYRPRPSLAARRELFRFSSWIFATNALYTVRMRAADLIIGRMIGSHALGVYTVAYEISNLATTELVAPINRVVFPGYAKLSGDLAELRRCFFDVISIIALVALPAAVGIAVTADLIVALFLGAKWMETVPVIQVLALFGAVTALQTNLGPIYWALGKPRVPAIFHGAYLAVLLPLFLALIPRFGMLGAAWASLGTALVMVPATYSVAIRLLGTTWRGLLAPLWRPVAATGAMALVVSLFLAQPEPTRHAANAGLLLAAAVLIGVATYGLAILVLWYLSGRPQGAERHLLDKIVPLVKPAVRQRAAS